MSAARVPVRGGSTVGELLERTRRELRELGDGEAAASSEFFLSELTGLGRSELYLDRTLRLGKAEEARLKAWTKRRLRHEPTAYITGRAYFWKEKLEVAPGCLIPRPETETMIEAVIGFSGWAKEDVFHFLDLGSGSGAIGIALMREFNKAHGSFSDVSPQALRLTERNLESYGLGKRSRVFQSDLFEGFKETGYRWDVICSNPPYFSEPDWAEVEPEIKYEPALALDGGRDGLDYYRRIAKQSRFFLNPGGALFVETGRGQALHVIEMFKKSGFEGIRVFRDDLGVDRVVAARWSDSWTRS